MGLSSLPYIIFLAPLIGAFFAGIVFINTRSFFAQLFSSSLVLITCVASAIICFFSIANGTAYDAHLYEWFILEHYTSSISITIDYITALMLFVVTLVSTAVHIYSIGYMKEDPHRQRFFAYLSLFTFFMIVLVTAKDFLQLFLGWEGVGLCSYLLIGFWFKKESANLASIKAFITNRVADVFMATGVCLIYYTFGTLEFSEIFTQINSGISQHYVSGMQINLAGYQFDSISFIGFMLFLGAMGKSAQLFLHVWLPDAMEGPTPVSALIHAATMVTAGVFLMAKCWIFVEHSYSLQQFITIIGATTAIFAASIALVQTDIKKIIAYSTCSQLGYMFFAIGVLVPTAGIFHLITHAFFKALLFLGAGSVIHACHHEQNIFKMGGLWKKIPFTFVMFMIGSIAIAGIYPFAGYFSKDAILEGAYTSQTIHGNYAFAMGLVSAFLTSLYSWRLIAVVFHGSYKGSDAHHPHESPLVMLAPLGVLAILSICVGLVGSHLHILSSEFWHGAIFVSHERLEDMHHISWTIKYLPSFLSILAIALAYVLYIKFPHIPRKINSALRPIVYILKKKYFFDQVYSALLVRPLMSLSKITINIVEKINDAILPHGAVFVAKILGRGVGRLQSGVTFIYFLFFFVFISLIFQYYSFISGRGVIYYAIIWLNNL